MSIEIPGDISVKRYFEEIVPQLFADELKSHPVQGMEGIDFKLQFTVTGENGGTYSVIVKNGSELQVKEGDIHDAHVSFELNEKDWRDSITGKEGAGTVMDMFFNPSLLNRSKYDALVGVKGAMNLVLARESGEPFKAKLKFNNTEIPTTTISMKASEYAAMLKGQLNPVTAFMSGKLKITGDMGLAMKLQTFIK
ncbi:MAG: SCP2 sterol-binding domain-containing protein [bacterium]